MIISYHTISLWSTGITLVGAGTSRRWDVVEKIVMYGTEDGATPQS